MNQNNSKSKELLKAIFAKEKKLCEASYYFFLLRAWKNVLEPATKFMDNWHIHYLCWLAQEEMLRIGRNQPKTRDLIVNVPPRSLKTSIFSTYLQPWCWGPASMPHLKFLTASYDDSLAVESAVHSRMLIRSEWYQGYWGDRFSLSGDQQLKTSFENDRTGHRIATSVGGASTGRGGDCLAAGTLISIKDGNIAIERLVQLYYHPKVLTFNHKTGKVEYGDIIAKRILKSKRLTRIRFSDGRTIDCTEDHRIFIKDRGYVEAGKIKTGESAILVKKNLPGLRMYKREAFKNLPKMLSKIKHTKDKTEMQLLWKRIRGVGLRSQEAYKEGTYRSLLRKSLFGKSPCNKKCNEMCALRKTKTWEKNLEILLSEMLGCGKASIENKKMRTMRKCIQDNIFSVIVLFKALCGYCPFKENDGKGEFAFSEKQKRSGVSLQTESLNKKERQKGMFGLQDPVKYCNTPYRQKLSEQQVGEFNNFMQYLPCEIAPYEERTISSIERLGGTEVDVYDLQVEKNHNFFANGILVHNCCLTDDPLSAKQAESEVYRETAKQWYSQTMFSRLNNSEVGINIIIMQRLHESDLTGHLLDKNPKKYFHVCLPALNDGTVRPKALAKKYEDNLLFPKRLSKKFLDDAKKSLGSYGFAGQYQQAPSPEEGGMFKRKFWRYWQFRGEHRPPVVVKNEKGELINIEPVDLPDYFDEIINSWDMSFKDLKESDYVAGGCLARSGADKYLLDQIREKLDFVDTVDAVKRLRDQSGFVTAVIVEEKANGAAVISQLKHEIPGMTPIQANDSKVSRANLAARQQAAGNLILPHPDIWPWVPDFIKELGDFPNAKNDDQVDQFCHGVRFLSDPSRQVVGSYRWNNPKHRNDFDVKSKMMFNPYSVNFAAMVQQEDLSLAHVFAVWDIRSGHLWVYDELLLPNPIPGIAVGEVRRIMSATCSAPEKFIAHPKMFSKVPAERTIVTQYAKAGIKPKQPIKFDENGAISMTVSMFQMGAITIHSKCVATDTQLREWVIANGRPASKNVGLPICICMIISDLDRRLNLFNAESRYVSYGKRENPSKITQDSMKRDAWQRK